MHPKAILARHLQCLRKLKGLSQEALADDAGLDSTYVSDLKREVYAASVDTINQSRETLYTKSIYRNLTL
jgi:transcriptional regulator with XRE-family HTH domain